ncbi:ABC transporter permease [Nonomuraea sp. NPDC046802]|uniref:ABC transporter permease n=1 Tax=Nonomuraea sp. NPDC046802 TaxID=3154919 RepID=UPI00340FAD1E
MKKGVFDRFRSLPIGRSAPLIGPVLGDLIRYLVAVVVLPAFGYALGLRAHGGRPAPAGACLLTMFFAFCLSWVFVPPGALMHEPGVVQGTAFVALFPLRFGTSMITSKETPPAVLACRRRT